LTLNVENALPLDALPLDALPLDALPLDALPLDALQQLMLAVGITVYETEITKLKKTAVIS